MQEMTSQMDAEDDQTDGPEDLAILNKKQDDVAKVFDRKKFEVEKLFFTWQEADLSCFPKEHDIKEKLQELESEWKEFEEKVKNRKSLLNNAVLTRVSKLLTLI